MCDATGAHHRQIMQPRSHAFTSLFYQRNTIRVRLCELASLAASFPSKNAQIFFWTGIRMGELFPNGYTLPHAYTQAKLLVETTTGNSGSLRAKYCTRKLYPAILLRNGTLLTSRKRRNIRCSENNVVNTKKSMIAKLKSEFHCANY